MDELQAQRPIDRLQAEVAKLPQYEPVTRHYFHGGMYCRECEQDARVIVVGSVHRREHFLVILSGIAVIGGADGEPQVIEGPAIVTSMPGTQRAILSRTPLRYFTMHRTDATTVEEAEADLVEPHPNSMYGPGNKLKEPALQVDQMEVLA